MNCQAVILEISNYIDGNLDAAMRLEVESHLKDCSECAVIVDQTKLTIDVFCDSQFVELPAEVRARFRKALRAKLQETSKGGPKNRPSS